MRAKSKHLRKTTKTNQLKISTLIFRMTVSVIPSCSVNSLTSNFSKTSIFQSSFSRTKSLKIFHPGVKIKSPKKKFNIFFFGLF